MQRDTIISIICELELRINKHSPIYISTLQKEFRKALLDLSDSELIAILADRFDKIDIDIDQL